MLRLTDLREILRYVPQFRDRVFVIALDGGVVEHDNFPNLLLDIALLRSLSIRVALVHGAAHQIRALAQQFRITPSNLDGRGVTDADTLQLALTAANRVSHEILEGLSRTDLRAACTNAIIAHPAGILQGIDQQFTGRVERIDTEFLRNLMQHDVVPVLPPLGLDGEGHTYRLNSDALAVDVARALEAVKLIYLTTEDGVRIEDKPGEASRLLRQLSVEDAEATLKTRRSALSRGMASKLEFAVRAARGGVPRIHIIDGRVDEGLLAEVFSNEGIGTLVHANEYQAIRRARKGDVRALLRLMEASMNNEELVRRTRAEVERQIDDYFIFELDRNPVGCAALHPYPEQNKAELASVCVDPKSENKGIGGKLIHFAEAQARARGFAELFCLSTQAVNYFVQKGGFRLGTPDDLPPERRERYDQSGRRSQVLLKKLTLGQDDKVTR